MKWFWALLALVLAVLVAPFIFAPSKPETATAITHGLPWQIDFPGPGQSRVFGLVLGDGLARPSTLGDARASFGDSPKLAIVAPADGALSLEAYYESANAGPLGGRMLLTLGASRDELEAMRARAAKAEYMETGTRKYLLDDADRDRADQMRLQAIAFIPAASLDADVVLQRFGQPAERIRQGETLEHFLYPAKGLDVVLDSKGKEVLQYVAPAAFERLAAPLHALAASK